MDAEQIVRALAAAEPPLVPITTADCTLCDALGSNEHIREPDGHDADCPWRLAREWVATSPG